MAGRIRTQVERLRRHLHIGEGEPWYAVRQWLDPDNPGAFDGPSDAEIEEKERAGYVVTVIDVTLTDDGSEVTGPDFRRECHDHNA